MLRKMRSNDLREKKRKRKIKGVGWKRERSMKSDK